MREWSNKIVCRLSACAVTFVWTDFTSKFVYLTWAHFPLGEFVRANSRKVGTDPTFSRRIFSLTNHIAKIWRGGGAGQISCVIGTNNWSHPADPLAGPNRLSSDRDKTQIRFRSVTAVLLVIRLRLLASELACSQKYCKKRKWRAKGNKLKDLWFSYRSHVNILKISIFIPVWLLLGLM